MSRMAKAPSSTGRLSPSETRAAVTLEEQARWRIRRWPPGGRPVSSAASRRDRMAASSMGRMVQATWPHELGEAHADEAEHCGTGGGDLGRHLGRAAADALPLKVGDHLGGLSHLIDLVKADLQQAVEHNIHAVQVLELPIQGGLRQGHAVLVLLQNVQTVAHRLDGLVGTDADTASAVDAPVGQNGGLAAADPDGLGGAALDAGGAAPQRFSSRTTECLMDHGAASPRFSKLIALRKP